MTAALELKWNDNIWQPWLLIPIWLKQQLNNTRRVEHALEVSWLLCSCEETKCINAEYTIYWVNLISHLEGVFIRILKWPAKICTNHLVNWTTMHLSTLWWSNVCVSVAMCRETSGSNGIVAGTLRFSRLEQFTASQSTRVSVLFLRFCSTPSSFSPLRHQRDTNTGGRLQYFSDCNHRNLSNTTCQDTHTHTHTHISLHCAWCHSCLEFVSSSQKSFPSSRSLSFYQHLHSHAQPLQYSPIFSQTHSHTHIHTPVVEIPPRWDVTRKQNKVMNSSWKKLDCINRTCSFRQSKNHSSDEKADALLLYEWKTFVCVLLAHWYSNNTSQQCFAVFIHQRGKWTFPDFRK